MSQAPPLPIHDPFTGYVVLDRCLMEADGFADFLFDNFLMIADITTDHHDVNNRSVFVMQSTHFTQGYGQYYIRIARHAPGVYEVEAVHKVEPKPY